MVEVFRQRFIIRSADLYVLKFAEEHPEQFTPAVLDSLRQHLANEPGRPDAKLTTNIYVKRKPGDFIRLYAEIRNKLKATRITNHEQIRQMFLRYDKDRNGFVSRENIVDLFRQINLPLENDIIDAVRRAGDGDSQHSFAVAFRWWPNARPTVKARSTSTISYDSSITENIDKPIFNNRL